MAASLDRCLLTGAGLPAQSLATQSRPGLLSRRRAQLVALHSLNGKAAARQPVKEAPDTDRSRTRARTHTHPLRRRAGTVLATEQRERACLQRPRLAPAHTHTETPRRHGARHRAA